MHKVKQVHFLILPVFLALTFTLNSQNKVANSSADIIIYGGTSAAITAVLRRSYMSWNR